MVSIVHAGRILRTLEHAVPERGAYLLHWRADRGTSNVAEESKTGAAGLK
jgi:hypothetical protein